MPAGPDGICRSAPHFSGGLVALSGGLVALSGGLVALSGGLVALSGGLVALHIMQAWRIAV